jgi:outer membrane immunogenic protein
MNKHFLLTTAALLTIGLVSFAEAADISVPRPFPAAAPVYNWTGIYIGANGGWAWGNQDPFNIITDRFDNFDIGFSGGTFGGTLGAQIQMAHVVLGIESDIDWANVKGSATVAPSIFSVPLGSTFNASTSINTITTARARVGYAQDNWLYYVTGGAAILGAKTDLTTVTGPVCGSAGFPNCSGTSHRLGAALGLGVEYGITPNWSVKAEYLYIAAASLEISHVNEVRFGVNYRFGGF